MDKKKKFDKNKKLYNITASISVVLLLLLLGYLFAQIYTMSKNSIVDNLSMDVGQKTKEIDYILKQSISELSLTADMVDDMLGSGKTNAEIKNYIIMESDKTIAVFEGNVTGLYAYVRGEWLDGAGWEPGPDYEPKTRPWYLAAAAANGEVVLVDPYVDAQTNTVLMTVAKMLPDGESVVGFDVYLFPIQDESERIALETGADILVLTDTGYIASSSMKNEIGGYLADSENGILQALFEKYKPNDNGDFRFTYGGDTYIVLNKATLGNWRVLVFLNLQDVISEVNDLYIGFFVVMVVVTFLAGYVIFMINRKRKSAEDTSKQLQSLADIYKAMFKLDFAKNTYEVRREDLNIISLVSETTAKPIDLICDIVTGLTSGIAGKKPMQRRDIIAELEMLAEVDVQTHEYETISGWVRDRFIVVDRNGKEPISVIWVLEDIDEVKRHEEYLEAEILRDELTNLLNRRAYERDLHDEGDAMPREDTVFITTDVNSLKLTNDNYGHIAGDELLKGAAACMKKCFGVRGKVYRTGGDEFVALLHASEEELQRMMKNFDASIARWKGNAVQQLSISCGYTTAREFPNKQILELARIADDRMYANKDRYYMSLGINRRRGSVENP